MLRTRVKAGAAAGIVLSVVFAALLGLLQSFDLFVEAWSPHFGEPTPVTLRVPYGPRLVRDQKSGGTGVAYEHARVIVPVGTILARDNDEHRAALAFEASRRPPSAPRLWGFAVINFT